MQSDPLVSIYISTHNRAERLQRAINSVLQQTCDDFELLICDDASTDETPRLVERLKKANKRIRYLRNSTPGGACRARNLGIFAARGKFITGLDDDDEFLPNRLERFITIWNDDYSFLCSNFLEKKPDQPTRPCFSTSQRVFTFQHLSLDNQATNQVFTLTERLQSIDGFRENVARFQDWDTWLRLCKKYGDFYRENTPLYIVYHDHSPDEKRVSKNISYDMALDALCERNKDILDPKTCFLLKSYARLLRGEYSLADAYKNALHQRSLRPFASYAGQFVRKHNLHKSVPSFMKP